MMNSGNIDEAIARSFKGLATKKSINKITIQEITDGAGVIRPTFYNHFLDKYDLLEWIIKSELITPLDNSLSSLKFSEGIASFMQHIKEEKEFYRNAVRIEGQNSFQQIMRSNIKDLILSHLDESTIKKLLWYEWLTPDLSADFFAESFTYAITTWIKDSMRIPINEIIECFAYIFTHSVLDMVVGISNEQKNQTDTFGS